MGVSSQLPTPLFPEKKKKKETLVLNQGSRCLYVFIYFDIYSVCCQAICLPGCIPEILKNIHGKATKIKDLCLRNSLQHFRPVPKKISVKGVAEELLLSSSHFEECFGWGPSTWWRIHPGWGSSSLLSEGPLLETFLQHTACHLLIRTPPASSIFTFYHWFFCYFFL